jgi:hypothetical protein
MARVCHGERALPRRAILRPVQDGLTSIDGASGEAPPCSPRVLDLSQPGRRAPAENCHG